MQGWLGTACPSETKISNQTFLSMPSDITGRVRFQSFPSPDSRNKIHFTQTLSLFGLTKLITTKRMSSAASSQSSACM